MSKKMRISCPCGRKHVLSVRDGKVKVETTGGKKPDEKSSKPSEEKDSRNVFVDFLTGRGQFADDVEVEDSDSDSEDETEEDEDE